MTLLIIRASCAAFLAVTLAAAASAAGEIPEWAYPSCPPQSHQAAKPNLAPVAVPGSGVRFTAAEIADRSVTRDWFPHEHAPLPSILATSHSTEKAACGYCHLPDGSGRPENAKLAGLTPSYIIAQVKAFQAKTRHAAQSEWKPTQLMVDATAGLSETEIAEAAKYFSQQRVRSYVRVVEAGEIPRHQLACYAFVRQPGSHVPLGSALVELPASVERFERRDPHTPYVAYVPQGSIARGRRLAATGGDGLTQRCADCHGAGLRGASALPGPPLAGRFPGYLFRQLLGFQLGARDGDAAQPMRAVAARLTTGDMIDLAAYAASLRP